MSKTQNLAADIYSKTRKSLSFLEDPRYFPVLAILLLIYIFFGPALLPHFIIEILNTWVVRVIMLVVVAVLLTGSPRLACLFLVAYLVTVLAAKSSIFDLFQNQEEKKQEDFNSVQFNAGLVQPDNFNYNTECLNQCDNAAKLPEGKADSPCNSVATFNPENNAQGINCPMGYDGSILGANF